VKDAIIREGIQGEIPRVKRKKQKVVKQAPEANLILRVDVQIEEAMEVAESTVVGRARGKFFSVQFIHKSVEQQWKKNVGDAFKVSGLAKGWFMIQFVKKEMVDWVLERNWASGKRPMLFRRWTPLFDAQREKVDTFPVWVRALGLPPFLWVDLVFRSIGNSLGIFLEADKSFVETRNKAMARILVMLNLEKGLPWKMKIHYKDFVYDQLLDNELLPYRCHICHEHGHLEKDCPCDYHRRRRQKKSDKGKFLEADEIVTGEKRTFIVKRMMLGRNSWL